MIQVLIERHIADGMLSTYEDSSRHALQKTYAVTGFISAEAFTDVHDPNHKFVLSKWRNAQDWHRWAQSEERLELINLISPVLTQPEKVTLIEN